ncbi:MAG: Ldh family oxidoreductase [Lachnospiraceae bacterium]
MSDYHFKSTVRVPFERVKEWSAEIYEKMGVSKRDAEIIADVQATADVRGVYSHGIQRCETYVWRIQNGTIAPGAVPVIDGDAGAFVMVDGRRAMGQISAFYAMQTAVERARKYGSSTVTVKGGNHFGTMAYYSMMAAKEHMIGITFTQGAGNNIAPTGGKEPVLGNNPIGYAIPAFSKPPVVVDMALTTVAMGKISMAQTVGNSIPLNWALDREGNPTSDPNQCHTLQPIAGYKGYGLSFATTLLTAVLCGAPWGYEQRDLLSRTHKYANDPLDIAYTMQVIDVGALMDAEAFEKRVDAAIEEIKSVPLREGVEEILVPGEPEHRTMERQMREGIEYPEELIAKVNRLSEEIGVSALV